MLLIFSTSCFWFYSCSDTSCCNVYMLVQETMQSPSTWRETILRSGKHTNRKRKKKLFSPLKKKRRLCGKMKCLYMVSSMWIPGLRQGGKPTLAGWISTSHLVLFPATAPVPASAPDLVSVKVLIQSLLLVLFILLVFLLLIILVLLFLILPLLLFLLLLLLIIQILLIVFLQVLPSIPEPTDYWADDDSRTISAHQGILSQIILDYQPFHMVSRKGFLMQMKMNLPQYRLRSAEFYQGLVIKVRAGK